MSIVLVAVAAQEVEISVTVSVTVVIPPVEYTTPVGFCKIDAAGAAPLPRFHDQVTPVDVPVLVKLTGKPEHSGAVDVKLATGVLDILIVSTAVCEHLASEIVKVTILVPDESYNTPVVFCEDETAGVAFCPKSHA